MIRPTATTMASPCSCAEAIAAAARILLAQALAACGYYGEGLSALRDAASLAEETGERYVEAEVHRLEGNLLLACGDRR